MYLLRLISLSAISLPFNEISPIKLVRPVTVSDELADTAPPNEAVVLADKSDSATTLSRNVATPETSRVLPNVAAPVTSILS